MDTKEILKHVDHTLLSQTATWEDIRQILDDAIKYGTASACIPPSYVKQAKEYVGDKLAICTVIGFPNGYNTSTVKALEATEAIANGADEVDMVINVGWVKDQKWDDLFAEIGIVREASMGKILKVIIETCFLTDEEKVKLCRIVADAGADYIKTSTGFGGGGATFEDVELMVRNSTQGLKVKASGGISGLEDAAKYLEIGADRLGTSRIVKAVKALEEEK